MNERTMDQSYYPQASASQVSTVPGGGLTGKRDWADWLFSWLTRLSAYMVLAILLGIILTLLYGSLPALHQFGWRFLTEATWDPVAGSFGARAPIFGTLATAFIALLMAVPVGFGIALFITELCPQPLRRPLGIAIELLAAIPSIIYGMWGLFVFAPFFSEHIQPWLNDYAGAIPGIGFLFQGPPMGIGIFTAGLILGIMVIPFIAAVMRDVFEVVPRVLKESAFAMGATTWEVVRTIVLPYTRVGVIGGIMLGLGRALGETMAVTFVIGNANQIPTSLFDAGNTIASALANEFTEATSDIYVSSLLALGLVLFLITFTVLVLAKLLLLRLQAGEGKRS